MSDTWSEGFRRELDRNQSQIGRRDGVFRDAVECQTESFLFFSVRLQSQNINLTAIDRGESIECATAMCYLQASMKSNACVRATHVLMRHSEMS